MVRWSRSNKKVLLPSEHRFDVVQENGNALPSGVHDIKVVNASEDEVTIRIRTIFKTAEIKVPVP